MVKCHLAYAQDLDLGEGLLEGKLERLIEAMVPWCVFVYFTICRSLTIFMKAAQLWWIVTIGASGFMVQG